MEAAFIAGNMAWNAGLVAIVWYSAKRWMDKVDSRAEKVQDQLKETADGLANDLKEVVTEHRTEYNAQVYNLNEGLTKIYEQLKVANGRTAKIEGKVDVQIAVCNERTRNDACRGL